MMKYCSVIISIALSACAARPESIAPAYVSEVPFQSWTCQQLAEEDVRVASAYTTAAQQQTNARTNDTVGVILLGLPVSTLSGDNIAPQIASLKGQQAAIQRTETLKNCKAGIMN